MKVSAVRGIKLVYGTDQKEKKEYGKEAVTADEAVLCGSDLRIRMADVFSGEGSCNDGKAAQPAF